MENNHFIIFNELKDKYFEEMFICTSRGQGESISPCKRVGVDFAKQMYTKTLLAKNN